MVFTDHLNRQVVLKKFPPERIISLVPSITELLVELGLENNLIGITKFCIHPERVFRTKERIGGTKNLNIEKIKHLQPDLIIGNKEENVKEQIEELEKHFPVWMSDVKTYEDALKLIKDIGELTNTQEKAFEIIDEIEQAYKNLENCDYYLKNKKAIYLIWYQPYIAVGNNTFIHSMMNKVKISNAASHKERYFEISTEEMKQLQPDVILLSSEPFPFKEKHQEELKQILNNQIKVILVDGEVFSWYGVRMKYLPEYLLKIGM
ncbi:MAG: helical backbone metal receptor [Bacteroidia bacterium]|nr:helical backbone metal receptor [Bacteroidia bacterium]